jgi:hypothetical protein
MFKWLYIVAPLFSSIPAALIWEKDGGKVEEHTRNAELNCVIPVQNLWSAVSPEAFRQVIDQKFVPSMIIVYSLLRYVMVLVAFYRSGIVGRFPDSTVRYYGTYGIPCSKIILVGTDLF